MSAGLATTGIASVANRIFQRQKRMLHPRLADLFEALVIGRATAHAIQILWNDRVIGVGQRKPIDWLGAIVARICPYREADLSPDGGIKLVNVLDISNYDVRAMQKIRRVRSDSML